MSLLLDEIQYKYLKGKPKILIFITLEYSTTGFISKFFSNHEPNIENKELSTDGLGVQNSPLNEIFIWNINLQGKISIDFLKQLFSHFTHELSEITRIFVSIK
jgi:hypothetical protein